MNVNISYDCAVCSYRNVCQTRLGLQVIELKLNVAAELRLLTYIITGAAIAGAMRGTCPPIFRQGDDMLLLLHDLPQKFTEKSMI